VIPTTIGQGSHSNFDSHANTNTNFYSERVKQDEQLKDLKSKIKEQLDAVKNIQRDDHSDDDKPSKSKKGETNKSAQNNSMLKSFMGGNDLH